MQITQILGAIAVAHGNKQESPEVYGTNINTPVFSMHTYCWCEREDCPWCAGCDCPTSAWEHFLDGKPITAAQYNKEFYDYAGETPLYGSLNYENRIAEWNAKIDERNRRYKQVHQPTCDYCLGKGKNATQFGAEPGKGAPNFWYKPTNLKIWWYKHMGRSQTTNRPVTAQEVADILRAAQLRQMKPIKHKNYLFQGIKP